MEFKSHVGSISNNINNRTEEVIGSATDIWVAYREGRFGTAPIPFLGYFLLLEDSDDVKSPVRNKEPYFEVDPIFRQAIADEPEPVATSKRKKAAPKKKKGTLGVSYSKRYEILCRRLVMERVYSAACLVMATKSKETVITQPADDLNFKRFEAALRGHVLTFLNSR
jgi:hypothetical protein